MKINDKLGKVIGLVTLSDNDEIILSSEKGILNKQESSQMRSQGRATQGVKIINLKSNDKLAILEKVKRDEAVLCSEEETKTETASESDRV